MEENTQSKELRSGSSIFICVGANPNLILCFQIKLI